VATKSNDEAGFAEALRSHAGAPGVDPTTGTLMPKYSQDQVHDFWRSQAVEHGSSASASWSDTPVINLEIRTISGYLCDGEKVLDAGCANGYSTIHYATVREISVLGLDYIPEMIEQARYRLASSPKLKGTALFQVGDITALHLDDASFDKVIVTRVIINLGEWPNQLRGIMECARVLRPGGLLLMSEATLQGWQRMNSFRREWHLPDIPIPPFNNYLNEEVVLAETAGVLELVAIVNFASTYFVGTRVLKPLLIRALNIDVDVADPNLNWNRWFSQLPTAGDYGTQKLFVLKKR
jgi:SAM-dependent methyltransferase